jgi:hypothetical protein
MRGLPPKNKFHACGFAKLGSLLDADREWLGAMLFATLTH